MTDRFSDDAPAAPQRAIRVVTGARLHFGLLDTAAPFGGVGVMVERPRTEIHVARSDAFRCDPSIVRRAEPILARLSRLAELEFPPRLDLRITGQPPPHSGFGSGTQLSLAIAEASSRLLAIPLAPETLACDVADRGKRSAVGVHGYFRGGLIYENSRQPVPLNPVQRRIELPSEWSVGTVLAEARD